KPAGARLCPDDAAVAEEAAGAALGDEVAGAIRPTRTGYVRAAGPTRSPRRPISDQALLEQLWLISHFGWIAKATIDRALIISDADLARLVVEQQDPTRRSLRIRSSASDG
ncbi:MAG: hypothetical protein ACXVGO_05265, partial [Mycobacterium sp.]